MVKWRENYEWTNDLHFFLEKRSMHFQKSYLKFGTRVNDKKRR